MKKVFGAIIVAATTLAGTAAIAENAVAERQAELKALLDKDRVSERQVSRNQDFSFFGLFPSIGSATFGVGDASRVDTASHWDRNFRLGRKFGTSGGN